MNKEWFGTRFLDFWNRRTDSKEVKYWEKLFQLVDLYELCPEYLSKEKRFLNIEASRLKRLSRSVRDFLKLSSATVKSNSVLLSIDGKNCDSVSVSIESNGKSIDYHFDSDRQKIGVVLKWTEGDTKEMMDGIFGTEGTLSSDLDVVFRSIERELTLRSRTSSS
jgi:hypothetical protein